MVKNSSANLLFAPPNLCDAGLWLDRDADALYTPLFVDELELAFFCLEMEEKEVNVRYVIA